MDVWACPQESKGVMVRGHARADTTQHWASYRQCSSINDGLAPPYHGGTRVHVMYALLYSRALMLCVHNQSNKSALCSPSYRRISFRPGDGDNLVHLAKRGSRTSRLQHTLERGRAVRRVGRHREDGSLHTHYCPQCTVLYIGRTAQTAEKGC